jgi:hypothetical protein
MIGNLISFRVEHNPGEVVKQVLLGLFRELLAEISPRSGGDQPANTETALGVGLWLESGPRRPICSCQSGRVCGLFSWRSGQVEGGFEAAIQFLYR